MLKHMEELVCLGVPCCSPCVGSRIPCVGSPCVGSHRLPQGHRDPRVAIQGGSEKVLKRCQQPHKVMASSISQLTAAKQSWLVSIVLVMKNQYYPCFVQRCSLKRASWAGTSATQFPAGRGAGQPPRSLCGGPGPHTGVHGGPGPWVEGRKEKRASLQPVHCFQLVGFQGSKGLSFLLHCLK